LVRLCTVDLEELPEFPELLFSLTVEADRRTVLPFWADDGFAAALLVTVDSDLRAVPALCPVDRLVLSVITVFVDLRDVPLFWPAVEFVRDWVLLTSVDLLEFPEVVPTADLLPILEVERVLEYRASPSLLDSGLE
jgi:hypothetical protein